MTLQAWVFICVVFTIGAAVRFLKFAHRCVKGTQPMTAEEAAKELGLSSGLSMQSWLKGGHFPGAFQRDGEWFFDPAEIAAVKADMEDMRERNRTHKGNWTIPDVDAGEPPLL